MEEKPNRDIFHIDQRSEQQKVNDLVEQYHNETALDKASDPVKDLEERLNKLKGIEAGQADVRPERGALNVPPADEEDPDKQYVKRVSRGRGLQEENQITDIFLRFLLKRCWTPS